jgi:hypothetical protein
LKRVSAEPQLPGAWSATPDEENMEEATTIGKAVDVIVRDNDPGAEGEPRHTLDVAQETSPERPLHDVDARIASPELVLNAGEGTRKRSGLVGMMTPQSPAKREGGGAGWVLVNVEGSPGG